MMSTTHAYVESSCILETCEHKFTDNLSAP